MEFNRGYICKDHGPMEKAITRNKRFVCPLCAKDVKPWEKPLEERPGRCSRCGCGGFRQALFKSDLLVQCHDCKEIYNVDKDRVEQPGNINNIEQNRIDNKKRSIKIREEMESKGELT